MIERDENGTVLTVTQRSLFPEVMGCLGGYDNTVRAAVFAKMMEGFNSALLDDEFPSQMVDMLRGQLADIAISSLKAVTKNPRETWAETRVRDEAIGKLRRLRGA